MRGGVLIIGPPKTTLRGRLWTTLWTTDLWITLTCGQGRVDAGQVVSLTSPDWCR